MPPDAFVVLPPPPPPPASFPITAHCAALSPSPVSPTSLVMLHTSLLLHIAAGSYFPHHPGGELRSQPGNRLPEHSPAARSPTRSRGWRLQAPRALPSPLGTSPEPPCPPGTCLSIPPRSVSKMCLGDRFPEVFAFREALPRNEAVLGAGTRGRWITLKFCS